MKNYLRAAAFLAAATGAYAPAFAQSTASVNTTGSTTIIQPITVTQLSPLAFGTIIRPASGSSSVSIGTGADTVSVLSGTAVALRGTTSRARYTVAGEGGETVVVTMPSSFNLTRTGAPDIAVALTRDPAGNLTLSGTTGSAGSATLGIGGTFSISSTTPTGDYSGSFQVTVAYN